MVLVIQRKQISFHVSDRKGLLEKERAFVLTFLETGWDLEDEDLRRRAFLSV